MLLEVIASFQIFKHWFPYLAESAVGQRDGPRPVVFVAWLAIGLVRAHLPFQPVPWLWPALADQYAISRRTREFSCWTFPSRGRNRVSAPTYKTSQRTATR